MKSNIGLQPASSQPAPHVHSDASPAVEVGILSKGLWTGCDLCCLNWYERSSQFSESFPFIRFAPVGMYCYTFFIPAYIGYSQGHQ